MQNNLTKNKPPRHAFDKFRKDSYILKTMVSKNFKAQYRNSLLGALWTVLNPLLNMLVMAVMFSNLFGNRPGVGIYPVYLFCGNIIFNVMRQITSQSLTCLVSGSGLIKKVKINYSIFPIANMFTALVNFAFSFVAMIIIMLIVHQQFYWTILLTFAILPAVMLFSLGIGMLLSCLFVFFRDIKHIYSVLLTLWTYLTPLFYTHTALNNEFATRIISLNPMTHFISAFRQVIQWGTAPSGKEFLICYGWALASLIVGAIIFNINKKKYIRYI